MNKLLRILAAAAAFAVAPAAFAGTFFAEKGISDPAFAAQFPEVAYYGGTIHAVWVGYPSSQSEIYYAYSTDNGNTWSAPINLSNTPSESEDRPQVTAGPNGVFVGWNTDNNTGAIYVARSTTPGVFGAPAVVADSGPAYYSRLTDLFTDSGGDVHVVYYDNGYNGGSSVGQIRHRMMCGAGAALNTDVAVTAKSVDGDVDNEEPRIGEAGGKMYVAFRSSRNGDPQGGWPPYSVQLTSGTKAGCTVNWTYPPRRIAGGVPFTFASTYRPEVVGDSTGTLHLTWWDNKAGANVAYRKGNLSTGLLGAATTVSNFNIDHLEPGGVSSSPSATLGGFQVPAGFVTNGTTAVVSYQQNAISVAAGFENGQIYLRQSDDNGTTWGTELPISGTGQATTPRLAMGGAGNGNVAIVWSDVRTQPARVYFRLYTVAAVAGPQFSITPSPVNYGSLQVGTSTSTTLTLVNTGTAGNIASIVAAGASGDFARAGGTCPATSGPIAGGATCTITVSFTPQALGVRSGTLTVNTDAVAGPTVAQLGGTGLGNTAGGATQFNANVSAVVTGYYETILGRSPDAGGLAFWSSEASRVVSLGADVREVFFAMSVQFFNSPEYVNRNTSDTQYLTDLYRTFFIREPDAGGLAFWQSQLSGGMDRGAMLNNFLFSTEFSNQMTSLFGTQVVRPEINMTIDLYRGILGVLPDSGGFNFWLGVIRQSQCQGAAAVSRTVSDLSATFIASAQYQQRDASRPANLRNFMYVGDLYNAFLRRGGDLGGYLNWANVINTGTASRDAVRAAFVNSTEFQTRVNAVIAAGCAP